MKERWKLLMLLAAFVAAYFIPWGDQAVKRSGLEAFLMLQDYARQHVLTCLVPAFFIAGAIACFISQASVLKYFGPQASRPLAYSVASCSGTMLSVCSCTVLPLFAGIYTRGAGIGPATAFLYSGPAINVLAIALTARVLGWQLGLARALGAIAFAVVAGLLMNLLFGRGQQQEAGPVHLPEAQESGRSLGQEAGFMLTLVAILIFAAWARPDQGAGGFWWALFQAKWYLAGAGLLLLAWMLWRWFRRDELNSWVQATWGFVKQMMPLLGAGVLVAGFLLGRPGHPALIPQGYIEPLLGGNGIMANLVAAAAGALMYFSTLTEVPILQGLLGAGMGQGPALALLLAGPALSLPNLLVIGGIMGWRKALTFAMIIVVLSTCAGLFYGHLVAWGS